MTVLQQIVSSSSLKWWSVDAWSRYFVELLSRLVRQLTIIVQHTSLHDQPCHKTMKKYEYFERMVISLLLPQKLEIQKWFCNCPTISLLISNCHLSAAQVYMIQERCWFSQIDFLYRVLSTSDQDFVFPANFYVHPHTQIGIIPFSRCTKRHSQFGIFLPAHVFNRTFSNCLSHNSPAKGCPYKFFSRGPTGSFHTGPWFWPFVFVVDESKCLGHSDLGIFNNLWASSIFTWVLADTASAACPSQTKQSGDDIHWS